ARPIGSPRAPGTLGYSPVSSWDIPQLAEAWCDIYGLAIVLWELWNGRNAFFGDRSAVLAAQSNFSFDCAIPPPPTVGRVFDAALARSDLVSSGAIILEQDALRGRAVLATLYSTQVREVSRRLTRALTSPPVHEVVATSVPPDDLAHVVDAVIDDLRIH